MTFVEFAWARQLLAEIGVGRLLRAQTIEAAAGENAHYADAVAAISRQR